MTAPVINPPTPYVCQVPGSFFPGQMVRIRGIAGPGGERFDINFQTRETTFDTDDIAFHISVRLLEGYIARNSFRDGGWEEEEDYGDLPFHAGQHFEMLILCEPTQFKIAINGRHYCDFKHRLTFTKISHFGIEGDVTINLIGFEGTATPPSYQQPSFGGQSQPGMFSPYGQPGMPQNNGMPTAPPSYDQAMNMPPMNQAPSMGMPQPYAPGYSYPPM